MNHHRDSDQTLRHWLDEGPDFAPERFVWAALEDVERTDQRGAIRASLEGIFMRIRPFAVTVAMAAALVVAVGAFALVNRPNNVGVDPSSPPTSFTSADVDRIMLADLDPPAGTVPAAAQVVGLDALFLPVLDGARELTIRQLDGYRYARSIEFTGTDDGRRYIVAAIAFDDAAAASGALGVYENAIRSVHGWTGPEDDPGLGAEGFLRFGSFIVTVSGDPSVFYMWREGNLLLASVAVDDVENTLADAMGSDARALALEMEARLE